MMIRVVESSSSNSSSNSSEDSDSNKAQLSTANIMNHLNQRRASVVGSLLLLSLLIAQFQGSACYTSPTTSSTTTTTTTTTTVKPPQTIQAPTPVSETSTSTSTSTTVAPVATTTPAGALLSGNEFVDFTETPIILFDGLANETSANDSSNGEAATSSPPNHLNHTTSSAAPNATTKTTTTTSPETTTTLPEATSPEATSPEATSPETTSPETTTTTSPETTASVNAETNSGSTTAENDQEEDYEPVEEAREPTKLAFEPPKNVSQYMDYIERLFHDLRHQITDLFEPHIPQLIRTSQMVHLSGSCSYDMLRMALALRQFEPWALRMIDSSGKVPEGIFEGSFTALGSYDECLSTVFSPSLSAGSQQAATQGKYCLVNVSPFLPPKPPADRVELMFQEEANRRNYTKDDQFSRLSPMFYYMQFRIGVCIPSTCVESDMDSISSALSSSLRLNITIPHCRVKHDPPLTRHQLVGGLVFALVLILVLGSTLMDYWRRKMERLAQKDNIYVLSLGDTAKQSQSPPPPPPTSPFSPVLLTDSDLKAAMAAAAATGHDGQYSERKSLDFNDRFRRNWKWMSFSLLTNYKLYFTHRPPPSLGPHKSHPETCQEQNPPPPPPIVRCLNGIRVLSLCWVIVANSYITLDPRATKRLSKTREAPKDFLFQVVAQASLAIETFFFLSGILVSMSYARKLRPSPAEADNGKRPSHLVQWLRFYVHRYIRMTPATMLVIAFTMFAFRYGDGPLWFEATHKAHMSCSENWWRHLLHVANLIDTRQMCFIHYWYIAADMQLFLFAPLLMFLVYQRRRIGYAVATLVGSASMGFIFYTTYVRNLPPTLLFYNSDPESRREFGNTIMTKPLTHALPYLVGMFVGKWLSSNSNQTNSMALNGTANRSLATLLGLTATLVALTEVFLPYRWNNSQLPTRFLAALYAAVFRFFWSLVLAYLVMACAHPLGRRCWRSCSKRIHQTPPSGGCWGGCCASKDTKHPESSGGLCLCGSGGNIVNRLLSLNIFTQLSKLSFVAYLIHLPLMSVFISQTRGLFSFSHTLVIHLALSYLVMTFILSFALVHIIEFPFLTFEHYLFERLFYAGSGSGKQPPTGDARDAKVGGNNRFAPPNGSSKIMRPNGNNNKPTRQLEDGGGGMADKGDYNYQGRSDKKLVRISQVNNQVGLEEHSAGGNGGGGAAAAARDQMMKLANYRNHNGVETFRVSERL